MTTETKETTMPKKSPKIEDIAVDLLHRDVDQPRKYFDEEDLNALKKSIEEKGLLYPVLFRVDAEGNMILVSGERRLRAYRALGKETIPAIKIVSDEYDEIALIDNIQRADLHPVDEAEAYNGLKDKHSYTDARIGEMVGKAHNTVFEIISLTLISQEVRDLARKRKDISRSALLKIAKIKKASAQMKAYESLVASLDTPKKEIKRPRLKGAVKTIKVTDTTLEHIRTIDLNTLGDDRGQVVLKLQELLQEITNKLDMLGS